MLEYSSIALSDAYRDWMYVISMAGRITLFIFDRFEKDQMNKYKQERCILDMHDRNVITNYIYKEESSDCTTGMKPCDSHKCIYSDFVIKRCQCETPEAFSALQQDGPGWHYPHTFVHARLLLAAAMDNCWWINQGGSSTISKLWCKHLWLDKLPIDYNQVTVVTINVTPAGYKEMV